MQDKDDNSSSDSDRQTMTLRPDVEILEGFDGVPLAFVAKEARYVRLGAGAAVVARLLDGKRTVAAISQEASVALQRRVSEQSVSAVLDHLAKVRLLVSAPDGTDAKSPEQMVPGSGTPTKLVPLLSAEKLDRVARPFAPSAGAQRPPSRGSRSAHYSSESFSQGRRSHGSCSRTQRRSSHLSR